MIFQLAFWLDNQCLRFSHPKVIFYSLITWWTQLQLVYDPERLKAFDFYRRQQLGRYSPSPTTSAHLSTVSLHSYHYISSSGWPKIHWLRRWPSLEQIAKNETVSRIWDSGWRAKEKKIGECTLTILYWQGFIPIPTDCLSSPHFLSYRIGLYMQSTTCEDVGWRSWENHI